MSDSDYNIERITQIAISEVCSVISHKIGRELSETEVGGIAAIIDTEHFWARAEELQMFTRHKNAKDVLNMVTNIGNRYRQVGKEAFAPAVPPTPSARYCGMCNGSGECYCIRKGPGTAEGCPRCTGDVKCRHCRGSGTI
jgi:hypothetical protein